jgi:hypothetical protein
LPLCVHKCAGTSEDGTRRKGGCLSWPCKWEQPHLPEEHTVWRTSSSTNWRFSKDELPWCHGNEASMRSDVPHLHHVVIHTSHTRARCVTDETHRPARHPFGGRVLAVPDTRIYGGRLPSPAPWPGIHRPFVFWKPKMNVDL